MAADSVTSSRRGRQKSGGEPIRGGYEKSAQVSHLVLEQLTEVTTMSSRRVTTSSSSEVTALVCVCLRCCAVHSLQKSNSARDPDIFKSLSSESAPH